MQLNETDVAPLESSCIGGQAAVNHAASVSPLRNQHASNATDQKKHRVRKNIAGGDEAMPGTFSSSIKYKTKGGHMGSLELLEPKASLLEPEASLDATKQTDASATLSQKPASTKALKPALKSSRSNKSGRSSNQRSLGVRGLWNEDVSNPFVSIDNELLFSILSYASATDLCRLSAVSKRFYCVSNADKAWKSLDATDVLQSMYLFHSKSDSATATTKTSLGLMSFLGKKRPEKLAIRSIGEQLSADTFLPCTKGLRELTLSGFNLTDTHAHVMLLGVSDGQIRAKTKSELRKLRLEDCPLLSNAVVRSIASHCPNVEELSLRGCGDISDLSALQKRWKHQHVASPSPPAILSASNTSSLASLFKAHPQSPTQKQPVKNKTLQSLFAAPAPKLPSASATSLLPGTSSTKSGSLATLFSPPGVLSPNRKPTLTPSVALVGSSSIATVSKLCRLDVSNTSITPSALLQALDSAKNRIVELQSLEMTNCGETWSDNDVTRLSEIVDMAGVQKLDIEFNSLASNNVIALTQGSGIGIGASCQMGFVRRASNTSEKGVTRLRSRSATSQRRL